ncbi:hypothetical protein [Winogradskyella flava]|uniref:hypothetical protein n=1 Tax=Winogradskyella flava TaxID=1884876 RepID=UPI00248FABF5|nr:hypothetical protein [Winogradskyella flava]
MFKKVIFTIAIVLFSVHISAQKSINDYKYIIVPKQFKFSKSDDQYQLNSLVKFLFNKYGYEAYFIDDQLPDDLKKDRCLALTSDVSKDKSGMFKTKLEIILADCYNNVVMTSKIGESRLKQYDRAYSQALRDAFETFQDLEYSYEPNNVLTPNENNKIEISEQTKEAEARSEAKVELSDDVIEESTSTELNNDIYYAQSKKGGYQIVDSEPKVVMFLLATAASDVFIVKGKSAIVYKEDGFWYYSENNGELKETKSLNIKF